MTEDSFIIVVFVVILLFYNSHGLVYTSVMIYRNAYTSGDKISKKNTLVEEESNLS